MEQYIQFTIICAQAFTDILIAEFAQLGFDTFVETNHGFVTYNTVNFDTKSIAPLIKKYGLTAQFSYTTTPVKKKNWNEEWEKNYEPIIVENKCIVKAPFHNNLPTYSLEILITPKMSFGTGHHETTYLMLAEMLKINMAKKSVLDAGTGTGVLSILAKKLEAKHVLAFDIDDWCVENALENANDNNLKLEVVLASIEDLELENSYDIILANINKNILLKQMGYYRKALKPGGLVLLSGFYAADLNDIVEKANQYQLKYEHHQAKNNWAMVVLRG